MFFVQCECIFFAVSPVPNASSRQGPCKAHATPMQGPVCFGITCELFMHLSCMNITSTFVLCPVPYGQRALDTGACDASSMQQWFCLQSPKVISTQSKKHALTLHTVAVRSKENASKVISTATVPSDASSLQCLLPFVLCALCIAHWTKGKRHCTKDQGQR